MELNLLLLPLLGGYLFYRFYNGTAYFAARCSNQRLLFTSAFCGMILLLGARTVELALRFQPTESIARAVGIGIVALSALTICTLAYLAFRAGLQQARGQQSSDFPSDELPKFNTEVSKLVLGGALAGILAVLGVEILTRIPGDVVCNLGLASLTLGALLLVLVTTAVWFRKVTQTPASFLGLRLCMLMVNMALLLLVVAWFQPEMAAAWQVFSPYEYSGTALIACATGATLWIPLNRLVFPYSAAIHRLYTKEHLNGLEKLLYESIIEEKQVQISLDCGKVYIGWVQELNSNLSAINGYTSVLPLLSGYRDDETKEFVITTHYHHVYEKYIDEEDNSVEFEDFCKVFPLSSIVVVSKFDGDAYQKFQTQPPRRDDASVAVTSVGEAPTRD